jgi:2,4-dienoyl-CoA reductase-like NADH-dependent reductase (Old Yellow Enzyme family)
MYNTLFQPLAVGPRDARNGIAFGSHTTNFARRNLLSAQHADYYAARAAGGAGIIVLEEHIVHPSDMPYEYALRGYLDEAPGAIRQVAQRIQEHGALALVQLNHNGQQSTGDHTQREMWAPSAVPDVSSREVPKAMELRDIAAVIEGFALVARHAVQGEADGIELNISDRSLLRQFLSPLTNQRVDGYGGALANRLRLVQETIEAVDGALGSDRVLGVRLCADELAPWAGLTPEQGVEIARLLAETGRVDYLTITQGSIFSTHMFPFHATMHIARGYAVHLAAQVKAAVSIPVFAAGRILTAQQAGRIISEGQADGVEMIRALIADPFLPRLSQAGRDAEVRPCISCNQGCQVRGTMNAALACNVNPDVFHGSAGARFIAPTSATSAFGDIAEDAMAKSYGQIQPCHSERSEESPSSGSEILRFAQNDMAPISIDKNLNRTPTIQGKSATRSYIVIGGGPAGMEAARMMAIRGKRVALYEREKALGGALALAAKGPGREELGLLIDYQRGELERLDVEIHLGTELTTEAVLEIRPEAVIIATGARAGSGLLPIPGHDLPHVTDPRRVLRGETVDGQRVVVIDETDSHGVLSVAELLAAQGHSVEILTQDWYVGRDLVATHDIVGWMQRALAHGVVLTPHTDIVRIEPGQVIVSDHYAAGECAIPADAVVLGVYERPTQELYFALKGRVPRLFRAGDCIAPRRIEQAVREGWQVGMQC